MFTGKIRPKFYIITSKYVMPTKEASQIVTLEISPKGDTFFVSMTSVNNPQ